MILKANHLPKVYKNCVSIKKIFDKAITAIIVDPELDKAT